MVDTNIVRRIRRKNSAFASGSEQEAGVGFILNSLGLITSVIGPALVVCLAGGSLLLFAAIVFYDTLGATVGVVLYQNATHSAVTSVVPSNRDNIPDVRQLRHAA